MDLHPMRSLRFHMHAMACVQYIHTNTVSHHGTHWKMCLMLNVLSPWSQWKDSLEVPGIFMLLSGSSSRNWLTYCQNEGYSGKLTGKILMRNIFDRCFSHALCALCCRILNLSFDMWQVARQLRVHILFVVVWMNILSVVSVKASPWRNKAIGCELWELKDSLFWVHLLCILFVDLYMNPQLSASSSAANLPWCAILHGL